MKLATIEKIINIVPIEGADRIVLAQILGWNCIIKKDEYQVGDLCIFIPIDVEVDTEYEYFKFLSKKKKWEKINTIKLRGIYSQGLIVPLSLLQKEDLFNSTLSEGLDVSNYLPLRKYEKQLNSSNGKNKFKSSIDINMSYKLENAKEFPTHLISKTDEYNMKNCPKAVREFCELDCYISLKIDGSSMTLIYNNGEFKVCQRNLELICQEHGMWILAKKLDLENKLKNLNINIAIQSEYVGPKVNGNMLDLKEFDIFVFNIKYLDSDKYLGYDDMLEICNKLELKSVPLIEKIKFDESWSIDRLQNIANKLTYNVCSERKGTIAEGLVIRPILPIYSPELQKMLSLKLINQNYKD